MAYTTIKKPSDYFNNKLYTGNGSTQSITGVGFQPDLTWIKQRNGTGYHNTYDAVRGSTKRLQNNVTDAEVTVATSLTSFDSDGFSLGSNGDTNGSSNTTVAWNWLGANGTTANTDGSISSTVSANTTSGFSIVSYSGNSTSGATVGHGLGVAPKVIIVKARDRGDNWILGHNSLGWTKYLQLNITNAANTATNIWNDTAPTSSVFTLGDNTPVNYTDNFIAYCFAEKQGFSKFGSYIGNGSTDGTFIYTGFKPAWVMIKANLAGEEWRIWDSTRGLYNLMGPTLVANSSAAEGTFNGIDFLSNGFKLRSLSSAVNRSGDTLIYMAFAEEPLVGDNPATAR